MKYWDTYVTENFPGKEETFKQLGVHCHATLRLVSAKCLQEAGFSAEDIKKLLQYAMDPHPTMHAFFQDLILICQLHGVTLQQTKDCGTVFCKDEEQFNGVVYDGGEFLLHNYLGGMRMQIRQAAIFRCPHCIAVFSYDEALQSHLRHEHSIVQES